MVFLAKPFRVFSFEQRQAGNRASGFAINLHFIINLGFLVRQGFVSSAKNRDEMVGCKLAGSVSASSRTTRASKGSLRRPSSRRYVLRGRE